MGGDDLPRGFESLPLRHFTASAHSLRKLFTTPPYPSQSQMTAARVSPPGRSARGVPKGRQDSAEEVPLVPLEHPGDRARRRHGDLHRPPGRRRLRQARGRGRALPPRRRRDAVLALHGRRLHPADRRQRRDPPRRHAGHGRRLPALVLRPALPARRAAGHLRRARPQALQAPAHRPPRRGPRRALAQVRHPRVLRRLVVAGRGARDAPLRPLGRLGAPHLRDAAHRVRHRPHGAHRRRSSARWSTSASSASTSAPRVRCSGSWPRSASSASSATRGPASTAACATAPAR